MVVVLAFVELVNGLVALKMATHQNRSLFKLGQDPVDRRQANIMAFLQQHPKYVFRRHMPLRTTLKNFQYFQAGHGRLEARAFEFIDVGHVLFSCAVEGAAV
jgi:hypothetical protein